MALLSIREDREYSAEWTLPGSNRSVSGRLLYNSKQAELSLNEAFTPLRGVITVSDPITTYPAIHGVSSKGEAISLLDAQSLGMSFNFSSGGVRQPERVISSWVIIGAHVTPDTLYSSVRFFIPGLEVWLSRPAIAQTIQTEEVGRIIENTFVVRSPETEVTPAPGIGATLEWGSGVTVSSNPFTSIDVTVRGWVVVRSETPQILQWFLEQQEKLATLLAFMAGVPMPVDAIQASVEQETSPFSVLVTMRQSELCSFKNPHDFFIPRGALESTFPSVVEQWFREVESVLVPSQLALGVLSTKNLWLHVEFLSLIQALEGFHRGRFSGNYMENPEYDSVRSVLVAAIPSSVASDHREALRSRIRYGNQISLSKRLKELRDFIGSPLAALIIASDGKVPRSWIDTRNYLSHWDEELRPNAVDGQEMYNANVRMEHLLRTLYLLLAGIPEETLIQCLNNRSRTSQQLVQLNIVARRTSDPPAPPGVLMSIQETSAPQLPPENDQPPQNE